MHKDEAKGAAKDMKGSIKQAAGRATNDPNLEAEGSADKVEGKVQKGVGALKDAARDVLKK
ncbi:MAG: CsbD family protein [Phenylobacterium sp.]|uniref:CsbD family protein n=1 Tax=Phenylobacterium sp. TaxID=1871053 RepID=UPI001A56AC29|nr:CsbD family protein [Phenylobacterium sp.]MBL8772529.1 CsbD family protein [Phenylobacterium sp.]